MKYDTVIFDLDGTLLNTIEDLKIATNYALRKFNYPERTLAEITSFVGNGVAGSILFMGTTTGSGTPAATGKV